MSDSAYQIVGCDYCKQRNRMIAEGRRNFCGRCGNPLTRMLASTAPTTAHRASNGWLKTFLVVAAILLILRGWSGGNSWSRPSANSHLAGTSRMQTWVAENGSYFGQISSQTGRPKTVHVDGYYRGDDGYVREHFRSPPR